MPYIYSQVDDLEDTAKVGSKQCVALLQHYAKLPPTSTWQEGKLVLGDMTIVKGTAIATFMDGKYKNLASGNHAAFYISQDVGGIWIMDQWANNKTKPTVSKRAIFERKESFRKVGILIPAIMRKPTRSLIEEIPTMRIFSTYSIVTLCILATPSLSFSSESYSCPSKVRLAAGTVEPDDVPAGYKSLVSNSIVRLTGVSMFDGPAEEGAALKPSSFASNGNVITWRFDGLYAHGKWVSCDYANGLIRVVKQAPDSAAFCTATIKKENPQKTLVAQITCK